MRCHAGCLTAALVATVGLRCTAAPAAEPQPNRPVSIVARSTKGTAGTGRRPIGERIVASNLPHRAPVAEAPPPPDLPEPPVPDEPSVAPEHARLDSDDPQPVVDAVPELMLVDAVPMLVDAVPELVDHEPAFDVAPPVADAEPPVAADAELLTAAIELIEPALAEAAAATLPALKPAPPKPFDAVRGRLLTRIKGVLAARPRAGTEAVSPAAFAGSSSRSADAGAPGSDAADPTSTEPAPESPAAPARLEFDVRESRSLVGEGEQIVMRIAVRNVGGLAAERVTATLFFAEGIEPVQAIGHVAEVFPGEVRFATVPELSPGSSVDLLVTAVGTRPGSVPYRGELACDQLAGLIAREGAVTVQPRRMPLP
jgi:hypothetical protein